MLPAYDLCLKVFAYLQPPGRPRGAISVAERTRYIGRVRALARASAEGYSEGSRRTRLSATQGKKRAIFKGLDALIAVAKGALIW